MPPKIKTDRETIIHAAFEVAQGGGVSAITAQSVAAALKTSVAPIFREFQTIEELRLAAVEKINLFHTDFIKNYPPVNSEFLTYGIAYIQFAEKYPNLFEAIMQQGSPPMDERMSGTLNFVLNSVGNESGLSFETAKQLFFNVWIYTHGIACLVYKGSLAITEEDTEKLLMAAFSAFYKNISKGELEGGSKKNETI